MDEATSTIRGSYNLWVPGRIWASGIIAHWCDNLCVRNTKCYISEYKLLTLINVQIT
jgi:hypothetical protein